MGFKYQLSRMGQDRGPQDKTSRDETVLVPAGRGRVMVNFALVLRLTSRRAPFSHIKKHRDPSIAPLLQLKWKLSSDLF